MLKNKIFLGAAGVVLAAALWYVAGLHREIGSLEEDLASLQDERDRLSLQLMQCRQNEDTLETALEKQNAQIDQARLEAEKMAERAEQRAGDAYRRLQAYLAADRAVNDNAEGMNEWLESLF